MIKKITNEILIPTGIFILLLLGMVYFPYIPLKLFNIDINKFSPSMKILYSFCTDIGYMIILFFLYKETLIDNFKKFTKNFKSNADTCFKYYFLGLAIMFVSNIVITIFFKGANANNENTIRELIGLYPLYMVFSVSIKAPFQEELIFRKSIKDMILTYKNNKFTKYLYIITSGLIFASLHVIGSATSPLDYLYIIPYLSLGLAFSSLYYKTDNIFSTMFIHCIHNTSAVLLLLLAGV